MLEMVGREKNASFAQGSSKLGTGSKQRSCCTSLKNTAETFRQEVDEKRHTAMNFFLSGRLCSSEDFLLPSVAAFGISACEGMVNDQRCACTEASFKWY